MGPVQFDAPVARRVLRSARERGQATVLWAAVLALAGLLLVPASLLAIAVLERSQAANAADAAALAGAAVDPAEARALARANGGHLLRYDDDGTVVEVVVAVGERSARARAERHRSAAGTNREGLDPRLQRALSAADALLGTPVPVASGFRTLADQQRLWRNRHKSPYPVAPPGTSKHEQGLAVDIPTAFLPRFLPVAGRVGLCRPLPRTDPVHFELC